MKGEWRKLGTFPDVKARALQVRVDALRKRLDAVSLLCDLAENAGASVAAESLQRARIAFDRVLEQLRDARHVSARDAEGLQERITEIKTRLLHASDRLRELRGEPRMRTASEAAGTTDGKDE